MEFRWFRDNEPIEGADKATYQITDADRGHLISVGVLQTVNDPDANNVLIIMAVGEVPEAGTIQLVLDAGNGTPEFGEPKLEEQEKAILEIAEASGIEDAETRQLEGEDAELRVVIANADKTVSEEDKKRVQAALKDKADNAKDLLYLDIAVYVKVGETETQVTDLGKHPLTLTVTAPERFKAPDNVIRTFHIVRVHDDKAAILTSSGQLQIPFSSALFSTYGLGASDEAVPTVTPTIAPTPTPTPAPTAAPTATPKPTSVKTGDDSNMPLWIGLLIALAAGMIAFNVSRRKKRKN